MCQKIWLVLKSFGRYGEQSAYVLVFMDDKGLCMIEIDFGFISLTENDLFSCNHNEFYINKINMRNK
jgi:hypothetical protein